MRNSAISSSGASTHERGPQARAVKRAMKSAGGGGGEATLFRDSEPSLGEQAYSTLEEMIVTLKLRPGASVSEAQLS